MSDGIYLRTHGGRSCRERAGVARADCVGDARGGRLPAVQQHRRAGSASPSATRMPTAGPRKAGGICRRAPAKRCSRAISSRGFITSMPLITITAASGSDKPICAPATRSLQFAASATVLRVALTAPASSKWIPASSAPGPSNLPNRASSRSQRPLAPGNPLTPIQSGPPTGARVAPARAPVPPARAREPVRRPHSRRPEAKRDEASAAHQTGGDAWASFFQSHDHQPAVRGRRRRVPDQYESHRARQDARTGRDDPRG